MSIFNFKNYCELGCYLKEKKLKTEILKISEETNYPQKKGKNGKNSFLTFLNLINVINCIYNIFSSNGFLDCDWY